MAIPNHPFESPGGGQGAGSQNPNQPASGTGNHQRHQPQQQSRNANLHSNHNALHMNAQAAISPSDNNNTPGPALPNKNLSISLNNSHSEKHSLHAPGHGHNQGQGNPNSAIQPSNNGNLSHRNTNNFKYEQPTQNSIPLPTNSRQSPIGSHSQSGNGQALFGMNGPDIKSYYTPSRTQNLELAGPGAVNQSQTHINQTNSLPMQMPVVDQLGLDLFTPKGPYPPGFPGFPPSLLPLAAGNVSNSLSAAANPSVAAAVAGVGGGPGAGGAVTFPGMPGMTMPGMDLCPFHTAQQVQGAASGQPPSAGGALTSHAMSPLNALNPLNQFSSLNNPLSQFNPLNPQFPNQLMNQLGSNLGNLNNFGNLNPFGGMGGGMGNFGIPQELATALQQLHQQQQINNTDSSATSTTGS